MNQSYRFSSLPWIWFTKVSKLMVQIYFGKPSSHCPNPNKNTIPSNSFHAAFPHTFPCLPFLKFLISIFSVQMPFPIGFVQEATPNFNSCFDCIHFWGHPKEQRQCNCHHKCLFCSVFAQFFCLHNFPTSTQDCILYGLSQYVGTLTEALKVHSTRDVVAIRGADRKSRAHANDVGVAAHGFLLPQPCVHPSPHPTPGRPGQDPHQAVRSEHQDGFVGRGVVPEQARAQVAQSRGQDVARPPGWLAPGGAVTAKDGRPGQRGGGEAGGARWHRGWDRH